MADEIPMTNCCPECPEGYVCHCLCVTEDMVISAIHKGATTFEELRHLTDAGNGCTACHPRLREYLNRYDVDAAEREAVRHTLATI